MRSLVHPLGCLIVLLSPTVAFGGRFSLVILLGFVFVFVSDVFLDSLIFLVVVTSDPTTPLPAAPRECDALHRRRPLSVRSARTLASSSSSSCSSLLGRAVGLLSLEPNPLAGRVEAHSERARRPLQRPERPVAGVQ